MSQGVPFLFQFNDIVGLKFRQNMETVDDLSDFGQDRTKAWDTALVEKVERVNQKKEGERTFFPPWKAGLKSGAEREIMIMLHL